MPGAVADDAGGQAEIAAVGDSERFLIILDADRRDDGAEHFLIVDPHVGRGFGDDGGLHVIAGGRRRRAVTADREAAALVARNADIAKILFELSLAARGADLRVDGERRADPERPDTFGESGT